MHICQWLSRPCIKPHHWIPLPSQHTENNATEVKQAVRAAFISGARSININFVETTAHPTVPPTTFAEFRHQLPDPVKTILGGGLDDITEDDAKSFAQTMSTADHITIFGDGSVKDGHGSHATRVYLTNTYGPDEQHVQTAAITSGDPSSITSLCSETTSALAGLLILQVFWDYFNVAITSITRFIYDNKECLRRLDLIPAFNDYANPLATDYDIWAELKQVATTLPMEIETEHVKAHQDPRTVPYDDLPTRQAQVNTDMDALATDIRESTHPIPKIPVF